MKLAHVMAGAPAGGAELFYERLTAALARAGDEVTAIVRRDAGRAERLRRAGLQPIELGFGGPLDLLTGPRLKRILRFAAPRVVVAWMNRAARFTPRGDWALIGRLGGFYDLSYYKKCDHLVGNTQGIVDWMAGQGWPAAQAHYLPNFVDDLAHAPPAALPVPAGAKVLLGLGRLHRNKGFDVSIRALRRLPGVHLAIAGEGPERTALEALARAEGVTDRVHLLGWRTDAGALLAASDVFVCSSRHEPLGNMVLEAWSAARPVLAAAAQGPRELIAHNADGALVAVNDPDALADGVQALLDDPVRARRLAEAGRRRYEADFAEAPVVARWREFFATVEKARCAALPD